MDFQRWAGLHYCAGGEVAAATGAGGWPAFGERYVSIVLRMPASHAPTHSSLIRQARFAHEINSPIRFSFGSLCGMTTFPSINGTSGINSNDFQILSCPPRLGSRPRAEGRLSSCVCHQVTYTTSIAWHVVGFIVAKQGAC